VNGPHITSSMHNTLCQDHKNSTGGDGWSSRLEQLYIHPINHPQLCLLPPPTKLEAHTTLQAMAFYNVTQVVDHYTPPPVV